jgi:hypothetical protein
MTVIVNGQKITTAKVVVMPDMFGTEVTINDESGVFYNAKCGKSMTVIIQEQLTGWSEFPNEST